MSDKLKNFIVRTLSGAVLLLVILGAMLVGFLGYLALLFFITVLGVREFYSLAKAKGYEPQRGLGLTLAIMVYLVGAFAGMSFEYQVSEYLLLAVYPVISIVPLIGLIFFVEVFRNRTTPIANVATNLAGVIYDAFPMSLMPG